MLTEKREHTFLEVMCLSESRKKGKMTVAEAGRMGGEKTSETHGSEFYSEIGSKGGLKVRELIEEGKEHGEE
jgi:general stress protein YciG